MLPKRGGFFCCPGCGSKVIRADVQTDAERLPVYCRKCKRELLIDIHRGQSFESRSPDQSTQD
ncbi:MAG: hypothetical protein IJI06_02525 [Oscillospiraceae bacterium]|nr:hypothetical protein [Oscillospiraceae bacterium]